MRVWILFLITWNLFAGSSDPNTSVSSDPEPVDSVPDTLAIAPVIETAPRQEVQWNSIWKQSLLYLGIEHSFRLMTEPGTRDGLHNPFVRGYARSVANLHGWSDGDPFYVNYVGHTLSGAVSGNLMLQNDPEYRAAEFGSGPRYWKGRARALAFTWLYSTQFEIGPLSEASLGQVQSLYPQQGFVDHVVTPVIGTGWMIAEDWIDKAIVKRVEDRVQTPWARIALRVGLNPGRGMANILAGRPPWTRYTRSGVLSYNPLLPEIPGRKPAFDAGLDAWRTMDEIPKLEVAAPFSVMRFGANACFGGSGIVTYRLSPSWELMAEVGGCKLTGLERNVSGDSLTYLIGSRWTPKPAGRWLPSSHLLVGGHKLSLERIDPELQKKYMRSPEDQSKDAAYLHSLYAQTSETNSLALSAGVGMDMNVNGVLALRLANVEYLRTWVPNPARSDYRNGLRFTTGIVLNVDSFR
jgi:hypothetical protein